MKFWNYYINIEHKLKFVLREESNPLPLDEKALIQPTKLYFLLFISSKVNNHNFSLYSSTLSTLDLSLFFNRDILV